MSVLRLNRLQGFTLLELMVVLGVISLVSAVTLPGLARLYDAVTGAIELEEVIIQINGLGRRSFETSRPARLDHNHLSLPEGWRVETDKPIAYSSRGFCSGGIVSLVRNDELQVRQYLKPPFCQVQNEG